MSNSTPEKPSKPPAAQDRRAARLKAALKANIAKRKAQARARDTEPRSDTDDNHDA
ncbi:hypothetical protein [Roseinatronobacter ekhonensis]|jgi:hypothetical protein|uniref:hypothetical protein n=1 Tax=Roseinatronobacter ekhonensis TaxID=254356 RepID=UPI0016033DAD|nr:hypothetical protein [Roseibaca ekhonensis]